MQFNLVAVLMLRLAALNLAAPGVAPEAKADAGNCCASMISTVLTDASSRIHAADNVNLEAMGAGY